ncbi:hypothetical protein EXIGLDRAFT_768762 [Exidia glandulosa HHB12029]|uniref:Phospholipase D/nuclease n=1 Tax=Exidia glandulosa HHB12029 TaxID=1314781 RepID=A0A165HYN6_EXIGL|nr:hypothetical protein EXIGLDRAFT_768762 [Exidia glandulosa HHB12029]
MPSNPSDLSPQPGDHQAAGVYDESKLGPPPHSLVPSSYSGTRQTSSAGAARTEEEEAIQIEALKLGKRPRHALEDDIDAIPKKARLSRTAEPLPFTFPDGALRITRTPGRLHDVNAISLPELIDRDQLVSTAIFAFFIADDDLLRHLPLHGQVPLHIGRDIHQDPLLHSLAQREGVNLNVNSKLTKAQFALLAPALAAEYTSRRGANYHAFYARATGCAHSKILVLECPNFLRLVITSTNMMDLDTEHGDNSWYIHDLPRLPKDVLLGDFEERLWDHLRVLGCPGDYIDGTLSGRFDFSRVRAHLVTSEPRTGKEYGMKRLRAVVTALGLEHAAISTKMEICTGSVGKLSLVWLRTFFGACTNSNLNPSNNTTSESVLPIQIVFPTRGAWGSAEGPGGPVNYECGVVIPGELLRRLRAPESRKASWENGVVPYVRPVVPYLRDLVCLPDGGCAMRPGRRGEYLHHDAECPVFLERPWTFNPNAVPQEGRSAGVVLTVE